MQSKNNGFKLSRAQLALPYGVFLLCFVLAPLIVIIYYAFTNAEGRFTLENFIGFFISSKTIGTLLYSLGIAIAATCICLILAYPAAYILARGKIKHASAVLMMLVMPMWINFTLRITALKEILTIIEGNLSFHPFLNTIIGMTYDFLPFMILPIYTTLLKLDKNLLEAASDLGADTVQTFLKVTLPLSVPGIISGIVMVFLPSMTNYVVLDMLYNRTYIMGSLIGAYFAAYDWHGGSMISLILLMIILVFTLYSGRHADEDAQGGKGVISR